MTEVEPDVFAYGSTVVATFQQGRYWGGGSSDIGFSTSLDNGLTWNPGSLPGITSFYGMGRYLSASDPSVAFNAAYGIWMIASLPVGPNLELFVSRSTNGLSWEDPVTAATISSGFFDKPWITCDNTPDSRFFGNCYLQWDDAARGDLILMTTSQDGGLTWGPALETADHATGLGGQPLVQPSGRVVVPYVSPSAKNMRAFISDDGGESWSSVVTIADVQAQFIPGGLRHFDLPSARIDGDGTIYVVWDDCRFRPSCRANDIVISTSTDGLTWSAPNLIPLHDTEGPTSHFIPGLAVDRTTSGGDVHLALAYYYYPDDNCTEATCQLIGGFTWSWDGGNSWGPAVDVTGPMMIGWLPDTASGRMVGDYIAAYFGSDGSAHPIFASASPPDGTLFFEATHTTCGVCPPPRAGHVAGGSCCNF